MPYLEMNAMLLTAPDSAPPGRAHETGWPQREVRNSTGRMGACGSRLMVRFYKCATFWQILIYRTRHAATEVLGASGLMTGL